MLKSSKLSQGTVNRSVGGALGAAGLQRIPGAVQLLQEKQSLAACLTKGWVAVVFTEKLA